LDDTNYYRTFEYDILTTDSIEANMVEIKFDGDFAALIKAKATPSGSHTQVIENWSHATLDTDIKQSTTETNCVSTAITTKVAFEVSVSASAGIPFGLSVEAKATVGGDRSSTKSSERCETKTFEISEALSVPPCTAINSTYFTKKARNIKMGYTAVTEYTWSGHTPDELETKLKSGGIVVTSKTANSVMGEIKGSVVVNVAFDLILSVSPLDKKNPKCVVKSTDRSLPFNGYSKTIPGQDQPQSYPRRQPQSTSRRNPSPSWSHGAGSSPLRRYTQGRH
jgi:hypothetical protein